MLILWMRIFALRISPNSPYIASYKFLELTFDYLPV